MKRFISFTIISCLTCFTCFAGKAQGDLRHNLNNIFYYPLPSDTVPQPDIRFEESVFDFGQISRTKKPKRTHSFVFENTGNSNLVILHAASGCGCTVPKFTKAPVKPGAKGKVDVTFNAKDRPLGNFAKSVTIYINSARSYVRIFIKGVVVE